MNAPLALACLALLAAPVRPQQAPALSATHVPGAGASGGPVASAKGADLTAPGFDAVFGYAEEIDGTSPAVHRLAGDELSVWNDPDFKRQFVESYLPVSDVEPKVSEIERPTLQKVADLIAADKMGEALALLTKESNPASSAVFDFTIANIQFQGDQLGLARDAYRSAVGKFPRFRRAWKNLALIHVREAAWKDAVAAFTQVIELGGGDAVTYGLLGYGYGNLENHLSAESAYRMALLLDPGTLDWKMGLARSLFKQERYADASALLGTLIAESPERTDLWLLQANAFIGLGQPMRAAENYELADRLGGSTPASLNMLGDIYVNESLYDLAVSSYVRAMEADPEASPDRPLRAAKVLAARGAFAETGQLVGRIETLYEGRLTDAVRKDLLKLQARLAVAGGAGDEEARVLEEIVALDPLDGEALLLLGQHASRNGDTERAIFWYERAASLEDFEADAKVRQAQLYVGQGRYAEALPLLRRAQTLDPRDNVQQYLEQVERVMQSR